MYNKAYQQEYSRKYSEKRKTYYRQWKENNPEKKKFSDRNYRETHAADVKASKKRYATDNAEQIKQYRHNHYLTAVKPIRQQRERKPRPTSYPHLRRAVTKTCPTCGTQFRAIHDNHRRKQIYCSQICYFQNRRVSHFETLVMEVIRAAGISLETQVKRGHWSFDASITNTSLLIEADGAFWHSSEKIRDRDERKNLWCKEHGYTLLRVKELDFYDSPAEAIASILEQWEQVTGQKPLPVPDHLNVKRYYNQRAVPVAGRNLRLVAK